MQAPTILFSLCLILALAVPSWGVSKKSCTPKSPQHTTVTVAPASHVVPAGAYTRDPAKIKEMQQYLKTLRLKAKEAAANRAAANAKLAGPEKTAPPQQTEGGTQ
jgi:hypothetical protein